MKTIIAVFIVLWILSILFRWLWNSYLREMCIILLPPRDHSNADEMEGLFDEYDRTFTDKKRTKR